MQIASYKNFSARTQGLIAINIAAVVFGSTALFGKLEVSPFWIVAMRAGFAALILFIVGLCKKDITIPPYNKWPAVFSTGAILAIHWLTFFASVQTAGVAVATLTFAAFPLFTVLLETFHRRRKPHSAEIIAALAILIAVALLVNPKNSEGNILGTLSGLVSALTFAIFGYVSKQIGKVLSPLSISFIQNLVVALVLSPFLFFVGNAPHQTTDWFLLILLGVVATALMHQLYFYALRRLSASTCSGFVALEPVYAILFAAILFHDALNLWVILSGILIIGASFTLLKLDKHP